MGGDLPTTVQDNLIVIQSLYNTPHTCHITSHTHMYNHKIKHDTKAAKKSNMIKFNDIKCPVPLSSPTTLSDNGGNIVGTGVIGVDFITSVELLILLGGKVVDVGTTMVGEEAVMYKAMSHRTTQRYS